MNIIFPLSMFIFGFWVMLSKPGYYSRRLGVYIDFSDIRWVLGPFAIACGLFWLWYSDKKNEEGKKECDENLVCPECKRIYSTRKNKLLKQCQKCRIELFTLEEFLEHIKTK